MPKIQQYVSRSQVAGPMDRPSASAETMGAGVGRGFERAGEALMGLGDHLQRRQEQAEVSDLNAKLAKAQAEYTKRWQETLKSADPADATLSERFNEGLQSHLDEIADGISTRSGQLHFEQTSARLKAHFYESTYAGQSQLAGIKAREDYEQALGSRASALLNDPTAFAVTMDLDNADIESRVANGQLPRAVAEQLKTQSRQALAKSAIRGWSQLDPVYAQKQLKEGKWDEYLSGDQKHQLFGEAQQEIRAREVEEARRKADAEKLKAEQQTQTQNTLLSKMVEGSLTVKDIMGSNLEAFGSGSKKQFLDMLEENSTKAIKTDPGTMIDLMQRIHAPDNDPRKIRDENELLQHFGKGLTIESLNQLRAEMQGKKTVTGKIEGDLKAQVLEVAKQNLVKTNPMLGIKDADGEENYLKFMSFFLTEFEAQKKQGKTATQLLSPDSPDYLGKHIKSYVKTPQQIMKGLTNRNAPITPTPTPEPRKEGESAADYLKRTKGQ